MLNGIISVLVVFLIIAVGFYFTKKNKWPENTSNVFSVTVINIAAPALAITTIENSFTPEVLLSSLRNVLIIAACFFTMYIFGRLLSIVMKMDKKKGAVFTTTFTFNNTIFIGLPVNQIIFGNEGLPYLFSYYFVSIVLFWTLGALTLQSASDKAAKSFSVKSVFSPGFFGVIIGCMLVVTELHLPTVLETALIYLGNICVPLSLLAIGSNLSKSFSISLKQISMDKIIILLGKFVINPLLIWGVFSLTGMTGLPLKVFILTASLPCHAQTAIMAEFYDLEKEYASNLVSLSTLVSLITIPLYASILL